MYMRELMLSKLVICEADVLLFNDYWSNFVLS